MARKPVLPDAALRALRADNKAVLKQDPGPERAPDLAVIARRAHVMRQINMAMHLAQLALDEDPASPALVIDAYLDDRDRQDPEQGLHDLLDLEDLGRWVGREDIQERAGRVFEDAARTFLADADEGNLRHRMRLLTSMRDRGWADGVLDRVRAG